MKKNIVREEFTMTHWNIIKSYKHLKLEQYILEAMESHAINFANFLKKDYSVEGNGEDVFWLNLDDNEYYTTQQAYNQYRNGNYENK